MVGIRSALSTLASLFVLMHGIAGAVAIQTLDYDERAGTINSDIDLSGFAAL